MRGLSIITNAWRGYCKFNHRFRIKSKSISVLLYISGLNQNKLAWWPPRMLVGSIIIFIRMPHCCFCSKKWEETFMLVDKIATFSFVLTSAFYWVEWSERTRETSNVYKDNNRTRRRHENECRNVWWVYDMNAKHVWDSRTCHITACFLHSYCAVFCSRKWLSFMTLCACWFMLVPWQ